MTKDEIIQQKKNEVLKKIRKIYHPLSKFSYNQYDEDSYAEQRDSEIRSLIQALEQDLKVLKIEKKKEKNNNNKEAMNNCDIFSRGGCDCLTTCVFYK